MKELRHIARNDASGPRIPHARSRHTGFTLIELLITMALMIIIATMYYGFGSSSHQRRQRKLCQQNIQKVYLAMQIYANDYNGMFPDKIDADTSEQALDVLVPRYTADTSTFICPGSKDDQLPAGESFLNRRISYAYYMGRRISENNEALLSDKQVNTQAKKVGDPLFSATGKAPGNNHHKFGGNVLFCDGRVEFSPSQSKFALPMPEHIVLLNPKP